MPYYHVPTEKEGNANEVLEKGTMELHTWKEQIKRKRDLKSLESFALKPYPGSSKGPHPEDDPVHYRSWLISQLPGHLVPYV
jgi:hypothetical protein